MNLPWLWLLYGAFKVLRSTCIPSSFTFSYPHCHMTTDSCCVCLASWQKLSCLLCVFLSTCKLFIQLCFMLLTCHLCSALNNYHAWSKLCTFGLLGLFPSMHSSHVNPQKTSASEGTLLLFHAGAFPLLLSCYVCDIYIYIFQLSPCLYYSETFYAILFTWCFSFILDQSQRKRLPFSGIIPYAQAPKGFHLFWLFCFPKHPFPMG